MPRLAANVPKVPRARLGAYVAAAAVLCLIASGCTRTTDGMAAASPTLGHAPKPVPVSALSNVLLDRNEASDVMAARLTVVGSRSDMFVNQPLPDGCLVWFEAQDHTYRGSEWAAVRVQELRDRPVDADHVVYQAVVSYADGLGAHDLYDRQVADWAGCDDRRVGLHDPDDPVTQYWVLSKATEHDGVLSITRSQEGTTRWGCQHAMTTKINVVIDVSACAYDVHDLGIQLAERIARKIA